MYKEKKVVFSRLGLRMLNKKQRLSNKKEPIRQSPYAPRYITRSEKVTVKKFTQRNNRTGEETVWYEEL